MFQNKRNKKKNIEILISIILILSFVFLATKGFTTFSISGSNIVGSSCTTVGSVYCSSEVNGVVTSLSQVEVNSSGNPLNGMVYLVSMTLNGAGQSLFGTTSAQLSQTTNQTVSKNEPISINAKLDSQNLVIPYYNSGTDLYITKYVPVSFNFSWFKNGAGLLTSYSQINQTSSSYNYTFAVSGSSADTDEANIFNAYNNDCLQATNNAGHVFATSGSAIIDGIVINQAFSLSCGYIASSRIANTYFSGSPMLSEKLTILYSNSTATHTFNLTNTVSEQSYKNLLQAQIVSYDIGSLNTFIGTEAPTLLWFNNNKTEFVPFTTTTDIQLLNNVSGSALQSAGISIAGVPVNFLYQLSSFQDAINQQNQNVENFINEKLQSGNAYYNIKRNDTTFCTFCQINLAYVNVTQNPVLIPNIQFLINAVSLGIYIPVAKPKIVSFSPDPLKITSGSQETLTFVSESNISGSAYIVITAPNGQKIAQSPNFYLTAYKNVQTQIPITYQNNNLANLQVSLNATIYSTENTSNNMSVSVPIVVNPVCPAGMIYYNNTNCKSETSNHCASGFYYNGTSCHTICALPSVFNATTQSCYLPIPPIKKQIGLGWFVLGGIVAIVIGGILYFKFNRKKYHKLL